MRNRLLLVLATLVLVVVGGCKKEEGGGPLPTDENAIQSLASSQNPQDTIATFSNSEESAIDDGGLPATPGDDYYVGQGFYPKVGEVTWPITPLRWGRQVQSVSRSVAVERLPGDTLAVATITKVVAGILHILAIRDSGGVRDTVQVTKAFEDTARRKVLFARIRHTEDPRLNWWPIAISLVEGHSPTSNFTIDSIEVMTPRDTVTVTDPLNTWLRFGFFGRFRILHIMPTDSVRVQVTISSQNDSSDLVWLHWGVGWGDGRRHRARIAMISESGGVGAWTRVYARTFHAHQHLGRFNAVIDALSYGTLFDDTAAYSNKFWGKPYICF